MKLTKREKRKLNEIGGINQEGMQPTPIKAINQESKKSYKKHIVISAIILVLLFGLYGIYSYAKTGQYDNFAKCLRENGAVMYGAMNWCKFTQAQKGMFGKSFKYLNYEEHTELPGIKKTPTWVVDGKWYENVQSLQRLSELTGCQIE